MKREYCKDCHWWEDSAERCGTSVMAPPVVEDGTRHPVRVGTCHRTHHFESRVEDDWCGEFVDKLET